MEQINYVEFPATNLAATKAFFSRIFAWEFEDYGPEYSAFSNAGLAGGFYLSSQKSTTGQGAALIVLITDNLEDSYEKVVAGGGHISKEIFSFPGGRRFHFIEPSGNEFAIWSHGESG
ncbi:VOC family protein [Psychrobium sp. 1_MG-2023]|uniref:VOC family protein n=1 Tax=Psychrobium sp. 1_MG-2023 TaxID=3062624 RepID=UPI0026823EEB|nr:VOC family protein [Psychrobium sp. 1_MG-2023]MDP2561761.1 VOC family protein [Psychrobium sp. 1_MG-2023]